eukprot:TRINITY_DN29071_c0_g1_i2.p1 TRINITY_DN29071_c0_g1~~TRINITY_DN29071_c0_g1_i2.p1  ORF type:complete len:304 (+),score=109.23 TRINITY_DN29071_c0_g1_i2:91-1002(+)
MQPTAPPMPSAPVAPTEPYAQPPPCGVAGAPAMNPYAPAPPMSNMDRLNHILAKYEITIADCADLAVLQDYEIVFIADDSGSMTLSSLPPHERRLGSPGPSRWDELCTTLRLVAEIACCLDDDGIDIYFLNRPPVKGVRSVDDPTFARSLAMPPQGTTPLTERLTEVIRSLGSSEKPVLLLIATDGEPNGGSHAFRRTVVDCVTKRSTRVNFKVQVLACTADEDSIAWMNDLDDAAPGIDVTDDYYSEKQQILAAGRVSRFSRSDWVTKALLGPILSKYDNLDTPLRRRPEQNHSADCGCVVS